MAGRLSCIFMLVVLTLLPCKYSIASATNCHPVLWPADSVLAEPFMQISKSTVNSLQKSANKLLNRPPHPVSITDSAGKRSSEGFKDADNAAVLALTYYLTHKDKYLNKAREILLSWSDGYHPTGNPFDETRLEGMIWGYDLISCQLSSRDNLTIKNWLEQLRIKNIAWKFESRTTTGNHRIHQYKMLLLLDKILQRHSDLQKDIENLEKYSKLTLNPKTGVSADYLESNALYYHNYVLQPWLEITLISGCCRQPVEKAFQFLSNQILSDHVNGGISYSKSKMNMFTANTVFDYAQQNGSFDVTKAAPTIIMYYTLDSTNPNEQLWTIQMLAKPSAWLEFLKTRRDLWHTQKLQAALLPKIISNPRQKRSLSRTGFNKFVTVQ